MGGGVNNLAVNYFIVKKIKQNIYKKNCIINTELLSLRRIE